MPFVQRQITYPLDSVDPKFYQQSPPNEMLGDMYFSSMVGVLNQVRPQIQDAQILKGHAQTLPVPAHARTIFMMSLTRPEATHSALRSWAPFPVCLFFLSLPLSTPLDRSSDTCRTSRARSSRTWRGKLRT